MEEFLPVVAGIGVGLLTWRVVPRALKYVALVGLSLVAGAGASCINGELAVSWVYVLIDTAQVLAAAGMTWLLAARWGESIWARMRTR